MVIASRAAFLTRNGPKEQMLSTPAVRCRSSTDTHHVRVELGAEVKPMLPALRMPIHNAHRTPEIDDVCRILLGRGEFRANVAFERPRAAFEMVPKPMGDLLSPSGGFG